MLKESMMHTEIIWKKRQIIRLKAIILYNKTKGWSTTPYFIRLRYFYMNRMDCKAYTIQIKQNNIEAIDVGIAKKLQQTWKKIINKRNNGKKKKNGFEQVNFLEFLHVWLPPLMSSELKHLERGESNHKQLLESTNQ